MQQQLLERTCRLWIEEVLLEPLNSDTELIQQLRSGVILCRLINVIQEGAISNIDESESDSSSKENVEKYLDSCKKLGIEDDKLFTYEELVSDDDVSHAKIYLNLHELSQYSEKITGEAALEEPVNFLQILNTTISTKKEEPASQKARRATFTQALRVSINQMEEDTDKDNETEREIVDWANSILSSSRKYSIDSPSSSQNSNSNSNSISFIPYRNLRQFRTGVGLVQLLEILLNSKVQAPYIKEPQTISHSIHNVTLAFNFLATHRYLDAHRFSTDWIDIKDIVTGRKDSIREILQYIREEFDHDYFFNSVLVLEMHDGSSNRSSASIDSSFISDSDSDEDGNRSRSLTISVDGFSSSVDILTPKTTISPPSKTEESSNISSTSHVSTIQSSSSSSIIDSIDYPNNNNTTTNSNTTTQTGDTNSTNNTSSDTNTTTTNTTTTTTVHQVIEIPVQVQEVSPIYEKIVEEVRTPDPSFNQRPSSPNIQDSTSNISITTEISETKTKSTTNNNNNNSTSNNTTTNNTNTNNTNNTTTNNETSAISKNKSGIVTLEESTNLLKSLIGGFSKSKSSQSTFSNSAPTTPTHSTPIVTPTLTPTSTPPIARTAPKDISNPASKPIAKDRPLPNTPIKSITPSSSPISSSPIAQKTISSPNLKQLPANNRPMGTMGAKSPELQNPSERKASRENVIVEVQVSDSKNTNSPKVEHPITPNRIDLKERYSIAVTPSSSSSASPSVNSNEPNVKRDRSAAVTVSRSNAPTPMPTVKKVAPNPPPAQFKPVRASVAVTAAQLADANKKPFNLNNNIKSNNNTNNNTNNTNNTNNKNVAKFQQPTASSANKTTEGESESSKSVKDKKAIFEGQRRSIIIPKPSQSSTLRPTNIATLTNNKAPAAAPRKPTAKVKRSASILQLQKAQNIVRQKIVTELLNTEITYVNSLCIIEGFMQMVKLGESLSDSEFNSIFANLADILEHHKGFLPILSERVDSWNESSQIADLFLNMKFLDSYKPYIQNYNSALAQLYFLSRNKSSFKTMVQEFEQDQKAATMLNVESFLIMPVQRIPRYVLFLKDLLKYTNSSLPDAVNIPKALDYVDGTLKAISEGIDKYLQERLSNLIKIERSMDGSFESIVHPQRRLVREGFLSFSTIKRDTLSKFPKFSLDILSRVTSNTAYVFLFGDIIVFASPKKQPIGEKIYDYSTVVNISELSKPEEVNESGFMFEVQGEKWIFWFSSSEQKVSWMNEILLLLMEKEKAAIETKKKMMMTKSQ